YHGLWRYASLADMVRLVRGITAGAAGGGAFFSLPPRLLGGFRAGFLVALGPPGLSFRAPPAWFPPAWVGGRAARPPAPRRRAARAHLRRRGRRRAGAPGAPEQSRPRARGGGIHRRRPGEGGHPDSRRPGAR